MQAEKVEERSFENIAGSVCPRLHNTAPRSLSPSRSSPPCPLLPSTWHLLSVAKFFFSLRKSVLRDFLRILCSRLRLTLAIVTPSTRPFSHFPRNRAELLFRFSKKLSRTARFFFFLFSWKKARPKACSNQKKKKREKTRRTICEEFECD